jgi:AGZA family xanthine/uracil permease-like MFS transporter
VVAALIAAFLSIIGFIHANGVGFAQPESMMFVYSYLMLAGLFGIKHFANVKENVTELEAQKLKSETA